LILQLRQIRQIQSRNMSIERLSNSVARKTYGGRCNSDGACGGSDSDQGRGGTTGGGSYSRVSSNFTGAFPTAQQYDGEEVIHTSTVCQTIGLDLSGFLRLASLVGTVADTIAEVLVLAQAGSIDSWAAKT
jgi:hypothetical protein